MRFVATGQHARRERLHGVVVGNKCLLHAIGVHFVVGLLSRFQGRRNNPACPSFAVRLRADHRPTRPDSIFIRRDNYLRTDKTNLLSHDISLHIKEDESDSVWSFNRTCSRDIYRFYEALGCPELNGSDCGIGEGKWFTHEQIETALFQMLIGEYDDREIQFLEKALATGGDVFIFFG